MPTYQIQAPDGNTYKIEGPPGATDAQVASEVLKQHPAAGTPKSADRHAQATVEKPEPVLNRIGSEAVGAAEGLASTATSAIGSLGGGLTYLGTLAATGGDTKAAAAVKSDTEEALTYRPKTQYGKADVQAVGNIMNTAIEKPTEWAGDVARRGTLALTGSPEASGAVGATVKTGLQAIPFALGARKAGAPLTEAGRPSATAAAETAARVKAEGAARDYITRHTGLDWDGLPDALKRTLSNVAARGEDLRRLDPKAVERVARAQAQDVPVPMSRAQATRDLADITEEENLRRTHAGTALRDIQARQDTALHRNLAKVREDVAPGSKVATSADVGPSVQSAARRKLQVMKADANRSYKDARAAGDMEAPVQWQPIEEWLKDPANKANAGWIEKRIKAYANPDGSISINNLERVRQEANAKVSEGGTAGHYAAQAKNVIDQILDNSGGDAYKAARGKWRAYNEEFKSQKAVRDLTSEKAGLTDRRVALEGTTDYVLKSDRESVQSIKDTLLKGGTEKTRARGAKAWADLQAGVIQKLREEAAGKRGIRNEQDAEQFNAAFLDRFGELDRSGKLEVLFGKKAADKLRSIAQTARDVRTTPADRVSGPNTASRLVAAMETFAHSTGLSFVARGARAAIDKVREDTRAQRAAETPLAEAERGATRRSKSEQRGARAARMTRTLKERYATGVAIDSQRDQPQ